MSRGLFWALNGGEQIEYHIKCETTTPLINNLNIASLKTVTIDWGDGDTTELTGDNSGIGHTYSTGGTKYIKFTGDVDQITYLHLSDGDGIKAVSLLGMTGLTELRLLLNQYSALTIYDIPEATLETTLDLRQAGITTLNLTPITFGVSCNVFIQTLLSLTSITLPIINTSGQVLIRQNSLDQVFGFGTNIISPIIAYSDNGMSLVNQDQNINDIYTNRAAFSSPSFTIIGDGFTGTPNATPSGTKDGVTDWSGGVPTSPMAKIYDLENNITGTYNFNFTDV